MPDDPMNGAAPAPVIDPPRIVVQLNAEGGLDIHYSNTTTLEFMVDAAYGILQIRRQERATRRRPRLVVPTGLLR